MNSAGIRHNFIGGSKATTELIESIATVAPTDASVLIYGETGTGKELVAQALHENGPHACGPLVAVNAAALPEHLVESELFGHERGAFTGAIALQKGKFELAQGGTLFLDEIGELGLPFQAKLLRALDTRKITRVGGQGSIPLDIRIIAATNRDLKKEVAARRFREDLYYRLRIVSIRTPPLRERPEDILTLAHHFLVNYARSERRSVDGIAPEAETILRNYRWPGNVRELRGVILHAVLFGKTDVITVKDLHAEVFSNATEPESYVDLIDETKRQLLRSALERGRTYKEVAAILGLHPNSVHRQLRNLNLKHQTPMESRRRLSSRSLDEAVFLAKRQFVENIMKLANDNFKKAAEMLDMHPAGLSRLLDGLGLSHLKKTHH